jgi:hypothetical protein|nr:hypothetical protein [uncultured Ruminococcus sp.]
MDKMVSGGERKLDSRIGTVCSSKRKTAPRLSLPMPSTQSAPASSKASTTKSKVAKRIGYGYRDDDFFFTLIRYLSIPSVRSPSHKKS